MKALPPEAAGFAEKEAVAAAELNEVLAACLMEAEQVILDLELERAVRELVAAN